MSAGPMAPPPCAWQPMQLKLSAPVSTLGLAHHVRAWNRVLRENRIDILASTFENDVKLVAEGHITAANAHGDIELERNTRKSRRRRSHNAQLERRRRQPRKIARLRSPDERRIQRALDHGANH